MEDTEKSPEVKLIELLQRDDSDHLRFLTEWSASITREDSAIETERVRVAFELTSLADREEALEADRQRFEATIDALAAWPSTSVRLLQLRASVAPLKVVG